MLIKTLVENTTTTKTLGSEHGLSLYIEALGHKLLFDVGQSRLFLENAQRLNIDIANVDLLIISHGHYDHGGGLRTFLQNNATARVYLHQKAFEKHYSIRANGKLEYIGLEDELQYNNQIIFTSDRCLITKRIYLYTNDVQKVPQPAANSSLFAESNGQRIKDTFIHEQNLVIEENGKTLLLTGCAHNGIINILEKFHVITGRMPDYVIGGFHLSSRSVGNESDENIDMIGNCLINTKARYYTCHCTGLVPYNRLKSMMGNNIAYLQTGSEVII